MAAHNILREIFEAPLLADPGSGGTIKLLDQSPMHCDLVSAGAEARTVQAPARAGAKLSIGGKTVAGTITLTITGGYNENNDTSFSITEAGQFIVLEAFNVSGTITWRKLADHNTANSSLVLQTPATPASVATSPGTAAPASLSGTGGTGGDTSIATTGTGGVGGGASFTGGVGGTASAAATAATGGAGGAVSFVGGAGGAEAIATVDSTGGAGGAITETSGAGGAVSGAVSGTATGGASGVVNVKSGVGGAVTATTGTNVGGASGAVTIASGVGGAASGATDTGGASGIVTITSGTGGAGDTGGASGNTIIGTGAAGAGGSPAVGFIGFNPGAAEKWRIEAAGNMTSVAGTPANAATTDGAILATGGISFTDVANAWIDDSTHGTGTVQHFIGNNTIDVTAPSDRRLKKNIAPTKVEALPLLNAVQMVDFDWKAEGADPTRQFGWIAQQVQEVLPDVVFSGEETAGMLFVKKNNLVTYLVKAIQELAAKVAVLEVGR